MNRFNIILVGMLCLFAACEPEPDDLKLLDEFVVSTNFDEAGDFANYQNFSLPVDTIGFISNNTTDTILTASQSSLVKPILTKINQNMTSRGYTRVEKTDNPDLRINVFIVNNIDFFQQVVYPGNYYPYSGYGGYGYGYGSSYYYNYPYVQTYESNTGALVIEIIDMVNRTVDNKVKVIWTAYMGDIINAVDREKQSVEAIDQAFIQSSYIQKQR
jgi:Domain of unknown function (DUF4136)